MNFPHHDAPHVLFLFSDTGGGHRSAAEAIIEAINLEFQNQITTEMVDFFKDYAPPPFDLAPAMYPPMAKMPDIWELGYRLSNGQRRKHVFYNVMWPYVRRASFRLVHEHPADLIVSVHPIPVSPLLSALNAMGPGRPPVITVVTDLVSTHAFWYNQLSDLVLVPTEAARQRGIVYGLEPGQVSVVGLPVADRFCQPMTDSVEVLRKRLGWPNDLPVLLLVGGGEGMGPVEKMALSIAQSRLKAALVVVTGRNHKLKERLEAVDWPMPTFIYGFVRDMPDFMRASDVLLTKAGPGTICEAFIAGLPIILYSKMPGQEDGNVSYVVEEGAGVWAPQTDQVISVLRSWLENPEKLEKVTAASRRLARPDASRRIARVIAAKVGLPAPQL